MQYHHHNGQVPCHPAGESGKPHLRVDFDRRLKLEFHGSKITSARIPQMNCKFDDVLGRFCYKNQCNTIITTGKSRVTRRVNPESLIYGSISTVA